MPEAQVTQARIAQIEQRLQALAPSHLEIIDDSHKHHGHAANQQGASHFTVRISSPQFVGLSRVAQQRLVYQQVQDLMPFPVHALAIQVIPE
ncbi:BolA family protein [Brackiella oedipodis]|uniref:BolA family protein n=1 Tax=Brackiella oedipodis TaxID=124225 RepID=UPI00048BB06C|nr:BolA family protein [Brackiella oedipodis]